MICQKDCRKAFHYEVEGFKQVLEYNWDGPSTRTHTYGIQPLPQGWLGATRLPRHESPRSSPSSSQLLSPLHWQSTSWPSSLPWQLSLFIFLSSPLPASLPSWSSWLPSLPPYQYHQHHYITTVIAITIVIIVVNFAVVDGIIIKFQLAGQRETRSKIAHAGSRTRVTSMGGLYDAATLQAPCDKKNENY